MIPVDRRRFLYWASAAAALAGTQRARAADPADLKAIQTEIEKHHDESVRRLQAWIRQPSIAAENRGMNEGCDLMMRMLRDAGFDHVTKVPTDGHPGVFATLDAGAPRTFGLYFMYDVKQADPAEWSSPPFEAALVDKPGLGKVLIGRGAVNQKGPEATLVAAFHAFKAAGPGASFPSTWYSWPKARKRSARRIFPKWCAGPISWRRCANARACTCRCRCNRSTAP
ncbi:exported hypothetical protein [Candidatus Sulfopaludibacter sp. SbA4]|nr:exported hypothetical protein [Candidatus Sulfopaludibacter sp. SbA4]